jgi:hypothetical protein
MSKPLVVVESPAKIKNISRDKDKFLFFKDYK